MDQFLQLRQEFQDRQILDIVSVSKGEELHGTDTLGVTFP
jgi:hypothetical protein